MKEKYNKIKPYFKVELIQAVAKKQTGKDVDIHRVYNAIHGKVKGEEVEKAIDFLIKQINKCTERRN